MKDEPHPLLRHPDPEHPSSTVIHHYGDDDTLLARWLRRALEKGPKFWTLVGAAAVATIALVVLVNGYLMGQSTGSQAWVDLMLARTPDQQSKVAEAFPKSEAARWGLLEAAGSIYNQGFDLLATNRDAASPLLKRAYKLYEQAYEESKVVDPTLARFAAFGMARTLEASGDLTQAIEQYKRVIATWPDTVQARQADRLARALQDGKNVEFYKWLATFKPPEATLPPLGQGILDIPAPTGPAGGLPTPPFPGSLLSPPSAEPGVGALPPPMPTPGVPAGSVPGGSPLEIPALPFETAPTPSPSPSPEATPPRTEGSPDAGKAAGKGVQEVPDDVFEPATPKA